MSRKDFRRYLELAASHGAKYAAAVARAEQDNGDETNINDALAHADFCRAAYGEGDAECTNDDDFDTSGKRHRPRVNDAGEPWWM